MRVARPEDLPRIVAAADEVFRPGQPGRMGTDYPRLFSADNAGGLAIAESDGDIVAHAGFVREEAEIQGQRVLVACFGAVFTQASRRGTGLGTRVLAAAIARARASGAELALISGDRDLYRRAGFTPHPPCRRYRIGRGAPVASMNVRPFGPDDLAIVMALQQAERVRFVRTPEIWRRLLATGVVFYDRGGLWLVERAGIPVAYAAIARPRPRTDGRTWARMLEVAGERESLANAVPALITDLGVDELEIVLPPYDAGLEATARAAGWDTGELQLPFAVARWSEKVAAISLPFLGLNYV